LKEEKENLKNQHQEYKNLKDKVQIKQKALQTYKKFIEANPIYRCHLCSNKVISIFF